MNDLHGMTTVLTFLALTALAAIIYSKTQSQLAKADRYRLIRFLATTVITLTMAVAVGNPLPALGVPAHLTLDRLIGPDP